MDVKVEQEKREEPRPNLAELLAMRRIPDAHAFALKLYVGDDRERPLSEWESLYREFMSKPTGMSKEQWHAQFTKNQER